MSINPEFRRNLWLHVSWQRLFAAPTVTALVVGAFAASQHPEWLYKAAGLACSVVLGLWGTRRAADLLSEEVSGGTWESQRMSGLGAWQMAWGKLIGGTAYVWYCAAFAILVLIGTRLQMAAAFPQEEPLLLTVYNLVMGGLLAHCVAFAVAIILLRKTLSYRRLTITLAQTCGFVAFLSFAYGGGSVTGVGNPYQDVQGLLGQEPGLLGNEVQADFLRAFAITVFGAWTVLGIYRLMRLELQYRNWPWAWTAFVGFMLLFAAGLKLDVSLGTVGWLIGPVLMAVFLTYASLFGDVRDPVRYRWALRAIRSGDLGQALYSTPWWLISFLATIGVAVAVILKLPGTEGLVAGGMELGRLLGMFNVGQLQASVVLMLLFMLRDILVVLWLSSGSKRQRADVSGLVFLVIAYVPLAAILLGLGAGKTFLPLVIPAAVSGTAFDFIPIVIEVAAIGFMLYGRWQAATRLGRKY